MPKKKFDGKLDSLENIKLPNFGEMFSGCVNPDKRTELEKLQDEVKSLNGIIKDLKLELAKEKNKNLISRSLDYLREQLENAVEYDDYEKEEELRLRISLLEGKGE